MPCCESAGPCCNSAGLGQMQKPSPPGLAVLSMHQPWASLLVYGLKRIEGRAWSTDYTGRLWIHATSTPPTAQDIEVLQAMDRQRLCCSTESCACTRHMHTLQEMQAFYKHVHTAEGREVTPNFPTSYPTSVLIGCVDVVACLPVSLPSWRLACMLPSLDAT